MIQYFTLNCEKVWLDLFSISTLQFTLRLACGITHSTLLHLSNNKTVNVFHSVQKVL